MENRGKPYQLNLRLGKLRDVPKYEFDRLRGITKLFEWRESRPQLLRLRKAYYAWIDESTGRVNFAERTPNPDKSRSPLIDSCVLVENQCAAAEPRYIQDAGLRQREIEAMYCT